MRAWLKEYWQLFAYLLIFLVCLYVEPIHCDLRIESKPTTQPSEVRP